MGGVCGATCNWGYETTCDKGTDDNGCWLGNYCMPATYTGANNATCYEMCPTTCNWQTEKSCDMGVDSNGCRMGDFCVPMKDDCLADVAVTSAPVGNGKGKGKRMGKGKNKGKKNKKKNKKNKTNKGKGKKAAGK